MLSLTSQESGLLKGTPKYCLFKHFFYLYFVSYRGADALRAIQHLDAIDLVLSEAPQTLVHNDCNPRNMCLRKNETATARLCLYDWELATVDTPQRDLVEFLSFVLEPSQNIETWSEAIHFYRKCLEEFTGYKYPSKKYIVFLYLNVMHVLY